MKSTINKLTNELINNSLISNIANLNRCENHNLNKIYVCDVSNEIVNHYDDIKNALTTSASTKIINQLYKIANTVEVINQNDYNTKQNSIIDIHTDIGNKICNLAKIYHCNKMIVTAPVLSLLQASLLNFKRYKENDCKSHCNKFVGYINDDIEVFVDVYGIDDSVLLIKNIDINYYDGFIYDEGHLNVDLNIKNANVMKFILENISFV